MRGSGLSIERFIKGKAQRTKSDANSKKKVIIHKAQRQRRYAKVKKREGSASTSDVGDSATGSSFYDRFFRELKSGDADEGVGEDEEVEARVDRRQETRDEKKQHTARPDPFFKAKKKVAIAKIEKQRARDDKQKRTVAAEKKVTQRKKRHVKLSQRTATGQPIVKNHINDILSRLQAEKQRESKQ
uniref:rRNA-processing protein FYV7 n=1 Tax=Peronospora matthiolae TaxID=2874970 RepID=A0AAV1ULJ6_9STRA